MKKTRADADIKNFQAVKTPRQETKPWDLDTQQEIKKHLTQVLFLESRFIHSKNAPDLYTEFEIKHIKDRIIEKHYLLFDLGVLRKPDCGPMGGEFKTPNGCQENDKFIEELSLLVIEGPKTKVEQQEVKSKPTFDHHAGKAPMQKRTALYTAMDKKMDEVMHLIQDAKEGNLDCGVLKGDKFRIEQYNEQIESLENLYNNFFRIKKELLAMVPKHP